MRPDHVPALAGESNESYGYATLGRLHHQAPRRHLRPAAGQVRPPRRRGRAAIARTVPPPSTLANVALVPIRPFAPAVSQETTRAAGWRRAQSVNVALYLIDAVERHVH